MKEVLIYKGYERFWHWSQAALIIFLAVTGFEVHGSYTFFGYENAVVYHRYAALGLIVLILFTAFWHFITGEWKQYKPTPQFVKEQIEYYLLGIFKNAPHPTKKTVLSKLNPLQKLAYFGLMVVIIPLLVITGILYLFYRMPSAANMNPLNLTNLEPIAILHTIGAYLLVMFVIGHLYLITTGHTIFTNLKAMITGYEEIEEDDDHHKKEEKKV